MIVIDTSALIAIVLGEPEADRCRKAINEGGELKISAGTIAETMILSDNRNVRTQMNALLARLDIETVPATSATAERMADAYRRWGKGNHPAGLNFGDCFAYALAKELSCPLLFVGNDFTRTDVIKA